MNTADIFSPFSVTHDASLGSTKADKKLRVALISSTFPHSRPGGVPTYVEGRATSLKRKCEVRIFALGTADTNTTDHVGLGMPEKFRRSFLPVWVRLIKELIQYRPHRIEIHNIPLGLPLFFLSRASYFFHGPAAMEAQVEGAGKLSIMARQCLERIVMYRASRIYVVSNAYRELVHGLYPGLARTDCNKIRKRYPKVLQPMSNLQMQEGGGYDTPALRLVCVRRLVKRTGVLEMVQAVIQAHQNRQLPEDYRLDIVGDGPLREPIQQLIAAHNMEHHIVMRGCLSNEQRSALYQASDFNIVPTQYLEGFGLVVVEAALLGCPSVVTEVGALPEVIRSLEGHGVSCQPDVSSMADALASLKKFSREQRKKLQEVALKKFALLV